MDATMRRKCAIRAAVLVAAVCACQTPRAPGQPDPPDQVMLLAARDRGDVVTMRAHAWQLWTDLQGRWQGFARSDIVLGQPDRVFRPLRPLRSGETIFAETAAESFPVMFAVAFDPT